MSSPGRRRSPLWWLPPILIAGFLTVLAGCWLLLRHLSPTADVVGAVVIAAGVVSCVLVWRGARGVRDLARVAADSSRRLAYAAQTGHELIWEIDPNGTVTYMNDVAREMFGADPTEIVGNSVFVLLPEPEQRRARALLADAVRERRGWSGLIFEALHSDGVMRWVETTSVAHLDDAGEVRSFTATSRRMDDDDFARREQETVRARVEGALRDQAIHTVFQPIVDVSEARILGYEALSRLSAEPAQPPDRWFADARACGLLEELDCLAMRTALMAAWQLPEDTYVSVNTTPSTLECGCLVSLLRETGFPGHRLVLEITEQVSVEDYQSLRGPVDDLPKLGVRIAVDDAGSGYASFRHILRLAPEFIKLDQEIIRNIHADPARRALATAVSYFAREVGATVVAEGVEVEEELRTVSGLGIGVVQGFLVGRPAAHPQQLHEQVRRFSGSLSSH